MEHFPDNSVPAVVAGFEVLLRAAISSSAPRQAQALADLRHMPARDTGTLTAEEMLQVRDALKAIERMRLGHYLRAPASPR